MKDGIGILIYLVLVLIWIVCGAVLAVVAAFHNEPLWVIVGLLMIRTGQAETVGRSNG